MVRDVVTIGRRAQQPGRSDLGRLLDPVAATAGAAVRCGNVRGTTGPHFGVGEIADRLHTPGTARQLSELRPGEIGELAAVAIAARDQEQERVVGEVGDRRRPHIGWCFVRLAQEVLNDEAVGERHEPGRRLRRGRPDCRKDRDRNASAEGDPRRSGSAGPCPGRVDEAGEASASPPNIQRLVEAQLRPAWAAPRRAMIPTIASPSAWGRADGAVGNVSRRNRESAGRPRRLAGDRWFRLGARIRKPLKFRIVNRIVETRQRSRTGASSQVRNSRVNPSYHIQTSPHPIAILRGWACLAFGRVSVSTPSSRLAPIFSWSIVPESANERP